MKRFDRLDLLPEGQDMVAGIDMTGGFYRLFQTSAPFPGCAFLLCLRGSCRVKGRRRGGHQVPAHDGRTARLRHEGKGLYQRLSGTEPQEHGAGLH